MSTLAEVFANVLNPADGTITTLHVAITSTTATTITTESAAPTALMGGVFRIRIDDELMLVVSGQGGTSWTVQRGAEGTGAATHASGARVRHVLTAGGLLAAQVGGLPEGGESGDVIVNVSPGQGEWASPGDVGLPGGASVGDSLIQGDSGPEWGDALLRVTDLNPGQHLLLAVISGTVAKIPASFVRLAAPADLDGVVHVSSVRLTWATVADAVSYRVLRGGVLLGTTGVATFRDATVVVSETYDYTVEAVDQFGVFSAASDAFEAFIDPALNQTPTILVTQYGRIVRVVVRDLDIQPLDLDVAIDSGTLTPVTAGVWGVAS